MPRITRVYTRTGDDGSTALGGGQRVATSGDLARAVGALLREPARRAEMGRRALALVEGGRGALARGTALLVKTISTSRSPGPR